MSDLSKEDVAVQMTKIILSHLAEGAGFGRHLGGMRVTEIRAEPEGLVRAELTVGEEHCNMMHTLHGAMISLIVDAVGAAACYARDRFRDPDRKSVNMSTALDTSFIRAAKLGEVVVVEARCLKLGKVQSVAQVDLFRKSDGALVATGRHSLLERIESKSKL